MCRPPDAIWHRGTMRVGDRLDVRGPSAVRFKGIDRTEFLDNRQFHGSAHDPDRPRAPARHRLTEKKSAAEQRKATASCSGSGATSLGSGGRSGG